MLCRSCLAVPASSAKMMAKAAGLDADEAMLDLEDACAPDEKEGARALAAEALCTLDFGRTVRALRMNALSTPWAERDVLDVAGAAAGHLDVLVVPKVESAAQVEQVERLLDRTGSSASLELQIETARGAVAIREIANASERTRAIVFGPGDYAASMRIPQRDLGTSDPRYPGHQWHWIMCELAVHARAAGLAAIDGPFADFGDEAGFRESALRSRLLGFDGKWCIHPSQIPWANEAFSPTEDEIASAEALLAAYDAAKARGDGAIALDGKMVDEASRRVAASTLDQARAAGLR